MRYADKFLNLGCKIEIKCYMFFIERTSEKINASCNIVLHQATNSVDIEITCLQNKECCTRIDCANIRLHCANLTSAI